MKAHFLATFSLILLIAVFSGCSAIIGELYASFYSPDINTEKRVHPLGITVYNQSGEKFSDWDWQMRFYTIEAAYTTFIECVGVKDAVLEQKIKSVPIIILPRKPPGVDFSALTDFVYIYVHRDRFFVFNLLHEWIHVYLRFSGRRFFGDFRHRDVLFRKC